MKAIRRITNIFFGNVYLRPFEKSLLFLWLGPVFKPLVFRVVKRPYLQAWALLLLVWAVLMGSMPSLYILSEQLLALLDGVLPDNLLLSFSWSLNLFLLGIGMWGFYYVTRLNLTKLYYWRSEKYPPWPSASVFYQIERYIFRPEFFALAIVTFLWIQLTHLLTDQVIVSGEVLDYQVYISLWVPWLVGAVWPMASIFVHRQLLDV